MFSKDKHLNNTYSNQSFDRVEAQQCESIKNNEHHLFSSFLTHIRFLFKKLSVSSELLAQIELVPNLLSTTF